MDPRVKTYTMPAAMVAGIVLHQEMAQLYFLTPYIIFVMLFIPFACVSPRDVRPGRMQIMMLLFQLSAGVGMYYLLRPMGEALAQGAMICIYAPAAMASATIGRMLGGDVKSMTTFIILSNLGTAIATPFLFPLMGAHADMPFWSSFAAIVQRVAILLLSPLAAIWLLQWLWPRGHAFVKRHQDWSFYAWAFSLLILIGKTTDNIVKAPTHNPLLEWSLAVAGLIICLVQFGVGHWWGKRNGDPVAGTQSLGQKNTTLAIWLTLTYLNPLAAIAPTSYIIWQNLVNSWQLWKSGKRGGK